MKIFRLPIGTIHQLGTRRNWIMDAIGMLILAVEVFILYLVL